jgi:hypothetical protein
VALAGRLLLGAALAAGGGLIGFYGVFAMLYRGDSPDGDPTVSIGDQRIDAQLVGAVAVAVALGMFFAAWRLTRRRAS